MTTSTVRSRATRHRALVPALIGSAIFAAIIAMAFRDGAYERVAYLELGVAAWIIVAIVAVARPDELRRVVASRAGLVLVLLLALGGLSALAMIWSDSAERSSLEALRVAGLAAIFVLGVFGTRVIGPRGVLLAVAAATVVVAGAALGSRMLFELYPESEIAEFLPALQNRLSYPLAYWNALGGLLAIGFPLIVHLAAFARSAAIRIAASAAAPMIGLAIFLTLSRGGLLAAVVATLVMILLSAERAKLVATVGVSVVLTAVLAIVANSQDDLFDALQTPTAETQGVELLLVTLTVMVIAAQLSPLVGWLEPRLARFGDSAARPFSGVDRRRALLGGSGLLVVAALVLVFSGAGEKIADEFEARTSEGATAGADRLTSLSSNTRTEYWSAALDAGAEHPLLGIGPGTWEFWWAENGGEGPFARDAHSLYLEAFAELGLPGALLVLALIVAILAAAVRAARSEPDGEQRAVYAALAGSAFAFAVAASLDWAWEVTLLPMVLMLVAAPLACAGAPAVTGRGHVARVLAVAGSVVVIAAFISVLRSELLIEASQESARDDDLAAALEDADAARKMRGYAATPFLQRALVEEAQGRLARAADSAAEAAEREPTNWRHQLIIARIQQARGNAAEAREAFDRGAELNPRSPVFAPGNRP